MRYPVIVHKDGGSDYGVTVPDFPGVFSGGETLDEALANVQDAIETFYEGEEVERLPDPSPLERVLASEDAEGGAVVLVDVNFDFLEKKAVPVNITVPLYLRNRIDRAAKARGMTRSAFLVRAAQAICNPQEAPPGPFSFYRAARRPGASLHAFVRMGAEHHAVLVGERPGFVERQSPEKVFPAPLKSMFAPDGTLRVGLHGDACGCRRFELPAAHLHDRRSVRHRDPVRAEADVALARLVPQLDGFRAVIGDLRSVGRQAGNKNGVREAVAARLYQHRIAVKRRRGHVSGLQKVVEPAIRDDEQSGVPRLDGYGQQKPAVCANGNTTGTPES